MSLTEREAFYFNKLDKHLTDMRFHVRRLKCRQEEQNYVFIVIDELRSYLARIAAREEQ